MKRRTLVLVLVAGFLAVTSVASAAWRSTTTATQTISTASFSAPATPTASVSGSTVTLTWTASTLGTKSPTAYVVKRYEASSAAAAVASQTCGSQATNGIVSCALTAVPDGSWQFTQTPQYLNWTGAESAKSAAATVTSTPASASIAFPLASAYNATTWANGCSTSAVDVCGSVSNATSVTLTLTQGSTTVWSGVAATISGSAWTYSPSATLADGAYTLTATASRPGAPSASTSVSFSIDRVAPTNVAITSPAENARVSGTITVTATASGANNVVLQQQIDSAWVTVATMGTTSSADTYSASYTVTKNGAIHLRVVATDVALNETISATRKVLG